MFFRPQVAPRSSHHARILWISSLILNLLLSTNPTVGYSQTLSPHNTAIDELQFRSQEIVPNTSNTSSDEIGSSQIASTNSLTHTLFAPIIDLPKNVRTTGAHRSGSSMAYIPFAPLELPPSLATWTGYPTAEFTLEQTSGVAPFTIRFQNHSTNTQDVHWDFGDGATSTEWTPTHTYTESGTYTVTLTATNPNGRDRVIHSGAVIVSDPMLAFKTDLRAGTAPFTVTFTSVLSETGGTVNDVTNEQLEIEQYLWDFGDGTIGNGITATHVYTQSGLFSVTLTAESAINSLVTFQEYAIMVTEPARTTMGLMTPAGGKITAANGQISLDFSAGALKEAHYISIDHTEMIQAITDTVDSTSRAILPPNGTPFYMMDLMAHDIDSLEAVDISFQAPVTLTYLYSQSAHAEVIDELIDPSSLRIEYFDEKSQSFVPVVSKPTSRQLKPTRQVSQISTILEHFSTYGISGDHAHWLTPSIDAASSQMSRGSSSYSYPIPLPNGPGGFAPQMALQYSSAIVNGMVGDESTDTGWVGAGWTLELGHIVKNDFIVLNNSSERLQNGGDGHYYLAHDTSMRITPRPLNTELSGGIKEIQDDVIYQATTKDGTVYTFGQTTGADGSTIGSTLSARWRVGGKCKHKNQVFKLAKVEDIHGNTIEVEYQEFAGQAKCSEDAAITTIGESYPRQIRYTTNSNANDSHSDYLVEFEIAAKGYNAYETARTGDGSHKLKAIHIYYVPYEGQRQRVRSLNFTYLTDSVAKTNLLTAVQVVGADGFSTLPATSFDYAPYEVRWRRPYEGDIECGPGTSNPTCSRGIRTGRHLRSFLTQIRNGYGGKVDLSYSHERSSQSISGTEEGLFLLLNERSATDMVTGLVSTHSYDYHQPNLKWQRVNGRNTILSYDRFFGFALADESDPLNRWTRHYFNNQQEHILNGYQISTWAYNDHPDVGGLLSATVNTYATPSWPVPRNVDEDEIDELVRFVTLSEHTRYHCEGETKGQAVSGCITLRTTQNADEWGNIVSETIYDASNNPYRHLNRTVLRHPTKWLFRTAAEELLDHGKNRIGMTWLSYDEQPNAPTQTLDSQPQLSHVRVWAGEEGFVDTHFEYDVYGNPIAQTIYDGYGSEDAFSTADPRHFQTNYGPHGLFPVAERNPLNHEVLTQYGYRFQQLVERKDPNGAATKTDYDPFGRIISVTLPSLSTTRSGEKHCGDYPDLIALYQDSSTSTERFPYFEQTKQRVDDCSGDPQYATTIAFYDGFGRQIQRQSHGDTANEWIVSDVGFDAVGRQIWTSVQRGVEHDEATSSSYLTPSWDALDKTIIAYDEQNRPVSVTAPDQSVTRSSYALISDNGGSLNRVLTTVTDANGYQDAQTQDEFGRLIAVQEFTGSSENEAVELYATTVYTYDFANNLVGVRDAHGNQTSIQYDALNRKVSMTDPNMGFWTYQYNALGNLIKQRDANGTITTQQYDKLNRVIRKSHSHLPAHVDPSPAVTYSYDTGINGKGRLSYMDDGFGRTAYTYDERGRLLRQRRTIGGDYAALTNDRDDGSYSTSYTYDAANRVLTTTYPDGEVVASTHTLRGLPQSLQSLATSSHIVDQADYNPLGQMTARLAGNGVSTSFGYYSAQAGHNRLRQIQVGDNLMGMDFSYDKVGNITKIVDNGSGFDEQRLSFSYDELDRLVSAKSQIGSERSTGLAASISGYQQRYTYDQIGNIQSRIRKEWDAEGVLTTDLVHIYQYSSQMPHAVERVNEDSYTYDANGNMMTRVERLDSGGSTSYTQQWTPFNKLAKVTWQDEAGNLRSLRFVYDGNGQRLLRVESAPDPEVPNGRQQQITTLYIGKLFEREFNTSADPLLVAHSKKSQPDDLSPNATANALRSPGLAAPMQTIYEDSVDFTAEPNPNVWEQSIGSGASAHVDGAWQIRRPAQPAQYTYVKWELTARIKSKARLNVGSAPGTVLSWRQRLNVGSENNIIGIRLKDPDADRTVAVQCGGAETASTYTCVYFIANGSGGTLRTVADDIKLNGLPLQKGNDYTFELRYVAARRMELTINNQLVAVGAFSVDEWQAMDWVTVQWDSWARGHTPSTVTASLDQLAYYGAVDNEVPLITLNGPAQESWLNAPEDITVSALDGITAHEGSGLKCLKVSWDDPIPSYASDCYTIIDTPITIEEEGQHTLYVNAWDWAGNLGTERAHYQLDTVAPTLDGPASTDVNCPALSNVWQNRCRSPFFTWEAATDVNSGVDKYKVYWGPSSTGTPTHPTSSPSYAAEPISSGGLYYLRVAAQDKAGNSSPPLTLFILKYDATRPTVATDVSSGCPDSVISDAWQNVCDDPLFTWHSSNDSSSQLSGYEVYWGPSPSGVPETFTADASYDPAQVPINSTNYLRIRALDQAGNRSETVTLFTLKYDGEPPAVPTMNDLELYMLGTEISVGWRGVEDGGIGGVTYQVRRATDKVCATKVEETSWQTDTTYIFTDLAFGRHYYCVRARDGLGNTSAWSRSVSSIQEDNATLIRTTKYYYFGDELVAMRRGNGLFYLHSDHLGSTVMVTDEAGEVVSEVRYDPYGEERFRSGTVTSDFGFTGQRDESAASLMDYDARMYSPKLGRFISPDTLVPDPATSAGLNRYRYAKNSPLRYSDPTGHCAFDEAGNINKFNCTVQDFQNLSWDQRAHWMDSFVEQYQLGNWFVDISGAIDILSNDADFSNIEGWAAYMDAAILQAVNDGMNIFQGRAVIGDGQGNHGGEAWSQFFTARETGEGATDENALIVLRLAGEQGGVNYARNLHETELRFNNEDLRIQMKINWFLWGADSYRSVGRWCRGNYGCDTDLTDPRRSTDTWLVRNVLGPAPDWVSRMTYSMIVNMVDDPMFGR